jgi:ribonuclease Y
MILLGILFLITGFAIGLNSGRSRSNERRQDLEREVNALLETARIEADAIRRNAEVAAKEASLAVKAAADGELKQRKLALHQKDGELSDRERALGRKLQELTLHEEDVGKKERTVSARQQALDAQAIELEQTLTLAKSNLEKIAAMTADEARAALTSQVIEDARREAAKEIKRIEDAATEEADQRAKTIIAAAIQRTAGEYVADKTVSVVPLPSDDMKGRIIGREGRNIRALEAATGIDLIIDDTPEAVVVSCFNPVRREVAKLALGKLIADGRIHPTRIEEVVHRCEAEINQQAKEAGEQAAFDLGLHRLHPELMLALGQLRFRQSYAQNLLQHSIEVGYLAGLLAGEVGLNVKTARRAGLLHDVGRGVGQEVEGSHAEAGAALAQRCGEAPNVVRAIAAHHGGTSPESLLDHIVEAANTLSAQRPGARRETLQSYVARLDDIERLCKTHQGVDKVFALQMGKEVRVLVDNSRVSDEQAVLLSRDLAKDIEDKLSFPGQVRVCVIRETRASDYAR